MTVFWYFRPRGSVCKFRSSDIIMAVIGRAHKSGHRVPIARGLRNSVVGRGWLAKEDMED